MTACNSVIDDGADELALRTIELRHGDGDVSIYDRAGNWLACEEGREAAVKEAHFVVTAFINGARWALAELTAGQGHLQRPSRRLPENTGVRPGGGSFLCPTVPESCGTPSVRVRQGGGRRRGVFGPPRVCFSGNGSDCRSSPGRWQPTRKAPRRGSLGSTAILSSTTPLTVHSRRASGTSGGGSSRA